MTTFTVDNHWLLVDGERVPYYPSPNHGGEIEPTIIVIHYTGTEGLDSPLSWLCKPTSKVSAHLVIDKSGDIYQLVPFNLKAWHAGTSSYMGEPGVNNFSIGIENVGLGDEWPVEQIEANRAIIETLFATYPTISDVVGHNEVAMPRGRKSDPGPFYPWDEVVRNVQTSQVIAVNCGPYQRGALYVQVMSWYAHTGLCAGAGGPGSFWG